MRASSERRGLGLRGKRPATVLIGLLAPIAVIVALPTAAGGADRHAFRDVHHTKGFWRAATLKRATPAPLRPAFKFKNADVHAFALNGASLRKVLVRAPQYGTQAARKHPVIVSLPAPNGRFERFALTKSQIMAPGLARKHRDIGTYYGRGIDDSSASIAPDLSHTGFPARAAPPPEPHRLPRRSPSRPRRLVHRPVLPQRHEPLCQLHRLGPRP